LEGRARDGARAAGAQGIVGNIPGQAVAFMTLFLQLLGMTDFWASALVALGMFAHALGGQAGGFLGDWAARRSPRYGRIVVCQISVAAGAAPGRSCAGGWSARRACVGCRGRGRACSAVLCQGVCMLGARRRAVRGSCALSKICSSVGLLAYETLAAASHKLLSGVEADQRAPAGPVPTARRPDMSLPAAKRRAAAPRVRSGSVLRRGRARPAGLVLTAVILKGLPHTDVASLVPAYAVVFVANGALNAWPAPACNNPIFAEVRVQPGLGTLVENPTGSRGREVGGGM
jgi:hypothetical protein